MSHFDHAGDAAADFALVKGMTAADAERNSSYLRRRMAAVAWIPGLLIVAMLGEWTQNGVVAIAGIIALIAAMFLYSERPWNKR